MSKASSKSNAASKTEAEKKAERDRRKAEKLRLEAERKAQVEAQRLEQERLEAERIAALEAQLAAFQAAAQAAASEREQRKEQLRKRIQWGAYGIALVCLSVTLPHLCCGIQAVTGCWWILAVPIAVVFDLAQIVAEHALMHRNEYALGEGVKKTAVGMIAGCTAVSMLINCMEFCGDKSPLSFAWCLGLLLGTALPAIVLACMFTASAYGRAKQ